MTVKRGPSSQKPLTEMFSCWSLSPPVSQKLAYLPTSGCRFKPWQARMFPCKLFKGCMLYMQTGSIELFSNQVYRPQCAYFRLDLNIELVGLPGGNLWLFMQWLCRKSCSRCVQSSHGRDISLAVYTTPQNKYPGIPQYMQRTYSVALCMLGRGQTAFG